MDFRSPRIRLVIIFLFLSWMLLYNFYFQRKSKRTIPTKNVIYVSPEGGSLKYEGKSYSTSLLTEALTEVRPGHTIFLFPGTYSGAFSLEKWASEAHPISLIGISAIFEGDHSLSQESGFCLKLRNSDWIFIENLAFQNCWASSIEIENSKNIFVNENDFRDSRFAIVATGKESANMVIQNNRWNQDPTDRIWTEYSWDDLHHGPLSYFNGAFFASFAIPGDVVIRKNEIRNAFNGIRMKGSANHVETINANVQIYENTFERIRDNVIEPEVSAYNWWIHHNRIHNAHAWFSFDEILGGYFYVFGNVGWNDETYGKPGDHSGGTVFKLTEKGGATPNLPIYIFHNTWHFKKTYLREDESSRYLRHFNNILIAEQKEVVFLTEENWHASYRFDYDLVNFPFSSFLLQKGIEKNGLQSEAYFTASASGDFSLKKESPAIDRGIILKIGNWASEFYGEAPDIGAFEGKFPVKGPPFERR